MWWVELQIGLCDTDCSYHKIQSVSCAIVKLCLIMELVHRLKWVEYARLLYRIISINFNCFITVYWDIMSIQ